MELQKKAILSKCFNTDVLITKDLMTIVHCGGLQEQADCFISL